MKEELLKAQLSMELIVKDLRSSHSKAIDSDDQFAAIAIMRSLEDAVALNYKIVELSTCAGNANA